VYLGIGWSDLRNFAVSRMYLLNMMTLELRAIHVAMYTAGCKESDCGSERLGRFGLTVGKTGCAGSRAWSSEARAFSSDMVAGCRACGDEAQRGLLSLWRLRKQTKESAMAASSGASPVELDWRRQLTTAVQGSLHRISCDAKVTGGVGQVRCAHTQSRGGTRRLAEADDGKGGSAGDEKSTDAGK
jgi:hypothetical protein